MEELIKQAFIHVDVIGPHVQEGHYDLIGPNGEIILPQVWDKVVEPDWTIEMRMWPMDKAPPRMPMPPHGMPLDPATRERMAHMAGMRQHGHARMGSFPPGMAPPGGRPAGGGGPQPPPPPGWVPPGVRPGGHGMPANVVTVEPGKPKHKSKPKGSMLNFLAGGGGKAPKKK